MSRDIHSVSSEETETHGRLYNMLASVGEKLDKLYDKIMGDEVICDAPELPFSSPIPGDTEHNPEAGHARESHK